MTILQIIMCLLSTWCILHHIEEFKMTPEERLRQALALGLRDDDAHDRALDVAVAIEALIYIGTILSFVGFA